MVRLRTFPAGTIVVPPPPPSMLVKLSESDSNAVGQAVAPDEWDGSFAPMTEIPQIKYFKHYSQSASDPITYLTDINTGGVRPYNVASVQNTGLQTTFAQEAVRNSNFLILDEFAISGTSAKQWAPTSTYPTSPALGPNIWTQDVIATHALETAQNAITKAVITVIAGNDGANSTDAGNCLTNLTAIVNGLIAQYPSLHAIVMVRNSDNQSAAVPFLTTIQAALDSVAASFSSLIAQVWTNDLKLHSDNTHFNGDSCAVLGQRVYYTMADKLGLSRLRPATPQIVGWGPQYTAAGVAYTAIGPGCSIAGDLEIGIAFSQMAAGTNSPITLPTSSGTAPWVAVGSQIVSTFSGSTSRMAVFSRVVNSTDLAANHGQTYPTTCPVTTPTINTINGFRICCVRGPNLNPTIDTSQFVANSTSGTSLTLTTLTTGFANEGVLMIAGGYRTNLNDNPVTMVPAGSLASAVSVFESNRAVGGDYITNAAWQATQVSASATGSVAVTFTLNTIACGGLIAIKP